MKVGFIPPRGLDERIWLNPFAMTLAQYIKRSDTYAKLVASGRTSGSYYVVVDNGAAEGQMVERTELDEAALAVNANELVLPDKMGDMPGTLRLVADYMHNRQKAWAPKLMGVVQGRTVKELHACIEQYLRFKQIRVLGVPRLLVSKLGSASRIDLANWVQNSYPGQFEIHFLGTSPTWVKEVSMTAKYAPHVRSVDSSMPYNYAIAGLRLDKTTEEISRVSSYFSRDWLGMVDMDLVEHNEQVMRTWANGDTI